MIYIIIPVFNRLEYTKACIQSLLKQSLTEYQIIVVDDGSSDDTSEYIQQNFPTVKTVDGDGSWWWAKSTNMGILTMLNDADDNDMILTLNNDLIVLPDYLESLMDAYNANKPCVVGSVSVWENNPEKIDFAGVLWNSIHAKYRPIKEKNMNYSALKRSKKTIFTDLLPGRGTLFPVKLVKLIGLYDDIHFPQYAADEDFSLRAKNAGYSLIVSTNSAVISHVMDTGINFRYIRPSVKTFFQSLTSIRSANHIKTRYFFAMKHGKFPFLYFISDMIRVFGSFAKHYFKFVYKSIK